MVKPVVLEIAALFLKNQWRLATAESCTGGLVASSITALAGSSDWFERGYVTYSNQAKSEDIGVDARLIEQHGAVSEEVARAMAQGTKQSSRSNVTLSITGIAGPTGGSTEKPIGTIWFAWALHDGSVVAEKKLFSGDREAIRVQACDYSLAKLLELSK